MSACWYVCFSPNTNRWFSPLCILPFSFLVTLVSLDQGGCCPPDETARRFRGKQRRQTGVLGTCCDGNPWPLDGWDLVDGRDLALPFCARCSSSVGVSEGDLPVQSSTTTRLASFFARRSLQQEEPKPQQGLQVRLVNLIQM
ncbi:unnamed protein product [Durusdinium trenchii]|uniref:Secreted protein n=1 Tax=Durusdinium trenchii TaxID=1381693 RepID=A0ABP0HUU3_9DINO